MLADGGWCGKKEAWSVKNEGREQYKTAVGRSSRYRYRWTDDCDGRECLGRLRNALCDSEDFVQEVVGLAERVKGRVKDAVFERDGGFSLRETLVGYYYGDSVKSRVAKLDRALDVLQQLRRSVRLQQQLLTAMAAGVRRACVLQDEVRARVSSLQWEQAAWWRLKWDPEWEAAQLAFVTFPAPEQTLAQLQRTMAQLQARDEPLLRSWAMGKAVALLASEMVDGWTKRLGLDDIPREPRYHPDDPPSKALTRKEAVL
jgi:hypothetical protein